MYQDVNNLCESDLFGRKFDSKIKQVKYTLAYYRVSQECVEHVFKHYTMAEVEMAIETLGKPTEFVHEPDGELLERLKLITGFKHWMPQWIPNDANKYVKKTDKENAKVVLIEILNTVKLAQAKLMGGRKKSG